MKNIFTIPAVFFLFSSLLFSQSDFIPSLALSDHEFEISGSGLSPNISSVEMIVKSDGGTKTYNLNVRGGKVDTVFTLSESGDYYFTFSGLSAESERLRVIPGWLSIVPPLLAILLALLFRQVVLSLILGIYAGAVFIYDYNPITGFLRLLDVYVINAVSDVSHVQIIIFTLLFGGMIGIMSKSGGTRGIANVITKFAKTRRSTLISAWFSGLVIFFDDYANTLIVGNLMRPVTDKMKISREKLSFIVDATAAPVASIFIISSWIGYEVGLIQDGLKMIGSDANAYSTFLATIPFRFYPIMMLVFVFFVSYFERDFGPMHRAEARAIKDDKPASDNFDTNNELEEASKIFGNEEKAKWYNGIIPIVVIVLGTIVGLIYTGIDSLHSQGITGYGLREIISNSDSYLSLLWSSFGACVVAAIMVLSQKIMSLTETIDAWILGIKSMLLAVLILTLAWSIGSITVEMKTADFIIGLISDSIAPHYLPVLVFLVCALTSFATGTSWGTMAIMMPIVIPLSHKVSGLYNLSPADTALILNGVISSVLAGCVFGDHCSPISDTTILSSMASRCNHVDHVRTQLPYAILVAIVCMMLGDIPTAFGLSPYISILLIGIVLLIVLFIFGKKVSIN